MEVKSSERPTFGVYQYPFIRTELLVNLERYRATHRPVGGFLQAVIKGDFGSVIVRADALNQDYNVLRDFYWYHHNELMAKQRDYDTWVLAWENTDAEPTD